MKIQNSTSEQVQPAPIYLRYIRIPFQINCRASAERVQLSPIYLRYISLASQSFLLPCWSCRGWLWNDSWILFWSLTWISEKKVKVKGNATISCNSNCYYYFNRPLFLFSPIHCDVLGYKLKYSWFEPLECIRYIAIYILSCRVHSIYCDIFFPAERLRYMTCRLTSDRSTKEFHH